MKAHMQKQMTDLEKQLFEMLVAILDGMVYAEDLQKITNLSKKRCEEIINNYWKIKKKFPY